MFTHSSSDVYKIQGKLSKAITLKMDSFKYFSGGRKRKQAPVLLRPGLKLHTFHTAVQVWILVNWTQSQELFNGNLTGQK